MEYNGGYHDQKGRNSKITQKQDKKNLLRRTKFTAENS